jgi:hypothetical protein
MVLIPGQTFLTIGIEVLLIGLIDWMTMGLLQHNSLRKMQSQYRREFVRDILLSQMAALSFVIAGVFLLILGTSGLYWIVAGTLLSFLAAFTDAWVLLIEINR